jgi:hypothetical protein
MENEKGSIMDTWVREYEGTREKQGEGANSPGF